ncbi:MAG: hypothetical protein ACHQO8_13185 [Vicinamibacterales bacterium]
MNVRFMLGDVDPRPPARQIVTPRRRTAPRAGATVLHLRAHTQDLDELIDGLASD